MNKIIKIDNLEAVSKKLKKEKKELLDELCKSVVIAESVGNWEKTVEACVKDFSKIGSLSTMPEVLDASQEHQLEVYPAALFYHANKAHDSQTE